VEYICNIYGTHRVRENGKTQRDGENEENETERKRKGESGERQSDGKNEKERPRETDIYMVIYMNTPCKINEQRERDRETDRKERQRGETER